MPDTAVETLNIPKARKPYSNQVLAPNQGLPEKVKASLRTAVSEMLDAGVKYYPATQAFQAELLFVAAKRNGGIIKRMAETVEVSYEWAWSILHGRAWKEPVNGFVKSKGHANGKGQ